LKNSVELHNEVVLLMRKGQSATVELWRNENLKFVRFFFVCCKIAFFVVICFFEESLSSHLGSDRYCLGRFLSCHQSLTGGHLELLSRAIAIFHNTVVKLACDDQSFALTPIAGFLV
jgi:hypothetical protein